MTPPYRPPTEAEEALAETLVDQAMQGLEHAAPPAIFEAIRNIMVGELLHLPEGRRKLRLLLPDPHVESSGDVPRAPLPAPAKKPKVGKAG